MKALSLRPAHRVRVAVVLAFALLAAIAARPVAAAPSGQLTWAVHISLAPTWFDPAETPSLITPFMTLYAMHDALVKFMPGAPQGKSCACGSSGAAACRAGGVMAWERARGEGARGRGGC